MKTLNEMKLTIESRSVNEGFARGAVALFSSQLDPTVEEITEIKTAVSEAVTNCIVHAYKQTIGLIYINAKIFDDNSIRIKIRDKGCGIDNIKRAMEPSFTTDPASERAGLGFAIMSAFTDNIKVYSSPGKGTSVLLCKKIKSKGQKICRQPETSKETS
ncbi:MAG: anti-sigma F factor [Oscillospiraceae bacterium]|nr:anti-sigma F factor [Oscillospiraceae bacterium]